jgi:hypothetical protein
MALVLKGGCSVSGLPPHLLVAGKKEIACSHVL